MALTLMLAWEKTVSLSLTYGVSAVNLGFYQVNGLELLVIPFQISCYWEKSAHLTGFETDDGQIYFSCSSLVLNFIMGVCV